MRRLLLAAAFMGVGAVALPASPAIAQCPGNTIDIAGVAYVNDDSGAWVYLESNGEPGLQRGGSGGAGLLAGNDDEICTDSENPDTLII